MLNNATCSSFPNDATVANQGSIQKSTNNRRRSKKKGWN